MNNTQNSNSQFSIPVLFLVFNRPDTTARVFQSIRRIQPMRLFIAGDGPRNSTPNDIKKVAEVRRIVSEIDWNCDCKTLFREKNLGCKHAVSSAINWFFENEEKGIILEDDCLPEQSFFYFCETMLNQYRDNKNIMHISGNNFQNGQKRGEGDYYFSIYSHIWGWATWKRAWEKFSLSVRDPKKIKEFIRGQIQDPRARKYWTDFLNKIQKNKIDTWDYYWTFSVWANNGLSILPNKNLVKNIGFGTDATHTFSPLAHVSPETMPISMPIHHATALTVDKSADLYTEKFIFQRSYILKRVINKLKEIIRS